MPLLHSTDLATLSTDTNNAKCVVCIVLADLEGRLAVVMPLSVGVIVEHQRGDS